ncbi:TlpA family protein disulfide reductase [Desulfovibrio inopinatus]|uniref:TlpA family protein disulfide reductase n=1 Tax=Desulfovibrio inopinatus TaxID=102109 RepID=UPI000483E600|nr:TlpA disulfide reductase family protein [Desulfovibrio inopinatus]
MKKYCVCVMFTVMLALAGLVAPLQARAADTLGLEELIDLISDARGKVVLVNFWASWCGPCRFEIPEIIKLRSRYSESELLIVGVSIDESRPMYEAFLQRTPFNYPVYLAGPGTAGAFGVNVVPKMLVYNKQGEQIVSHNGFMGAEDLEDVVEKNING